MPAPARKTAPKKTAEPVAPSEAAAHEAIGDGEILLDFRGEKFHIKDAEVRSSFRYAMALAGGLEHQMIFELIQPKDRTRFISLAKPGESFVEVGGEFFTALAQASGEGNSTTS